MIRVSKTILKKYETGKLEKFEEKKEETKVLYDKDCEYKSYKENIGYETFLEYTTQLVQRIEKQDKLKILINHLNKNQTFISYENSVKLPNEIMNILEWDVLDIINIKVEKGKLIFELYNKFEEFKQELDLLPPEEEEMNKKELKRFKKGLKESKKGKVKSWEELSDDREMWE